MIKALQRMVGPYSKPIKVTPLTKLLPTRNSVDISNENVFRSVQTLKLDDLIIEDNQVENYYHVPKNQINNIVSFYDIDDWSYLLEKFSDVLSNLMRVVSNLRKQVYNKVLTTELEKREILRRHNTLKEKLLDKTDEVSDIEAKSDLTDKEKIQKLTDTLAALGFTAAGMMAQGLPPPGAELDAATLAQVRASGADLIAAAHLATLEASSPQHVSDVMQVILNRARGQSGGIPAVITAREQFTPYSAAIYGGSPGDPAASAKYGNLKVTKAEIFQLASQPNGLQALTDRFNAGNPSVAAQVLMDIKSGGPLSTSSKQFVGGAQYFTGYPKAGARRRPDGGNYFRDRYSSGAILNNAEMILPNRIDIPELFDTHTIRYDSYRKNTLLSKFIVDRPTIIDMKNVREPLIIIPLGRPIGKMILKKIFAHPFNIIENRFKTLISRNQESKSLEEISIESKNKILPVKTNSISLPSEISIEQKGSSEQIISDESYMLEQLTIDYQRKETSKTIIDTTETTTENLLNNKTSSVILFTQDIFVT